MATWGVAAQDCEWASPSRPEAGDSRVVRLEVGHGVGPAGGTVIAQVRARLEGKRPKVVSTGWTNARKGSVFPGQEGTEQGLQNGLVMGGCSGVPGKGLGHVSGELKMFG